MILSGIKDTNPRVGLINMKQLVNLLEPHLLSSGLISQNSIEEMLILTEKLPPLSGAGLEFHLGNTPPRTDFLIRATTEDSGREAFADKQQQLKVNIELFESDAWKPLRNFFNEWANPVSSLYHQVEDIWLEFDIEDKVNLLPSVFFDIDRQNLLNSDEKIKVMELAVEKLSQPLERTVSNTIKMCMERAPAETRFYYLGVMLSRRDYGVRLCFVGFEAFWIPAYLKSIGWKGNSSVLNTILNVYACNADKIILDIDVSTSVQPQVGVEIFFDSQLMWDEFFKLLVKNKICSTEDIKKISRWPGFDIEEKSQIIQELSKITGREIRYLVRRLNHIKLACDTSGDIKAKAYLYFCYC